MTPSHKSHPLALLFTSLLLLGGGLIATDSTSANPYVPEPGSAWREYTLLNEGNDWRVTQSDAQRKGARDFLPNPILAFPKVVLKNAIRAELVIDFWSGHEGTGNKRLRMNSRQWLDLPEYLAGSDVEAKERLAQYTMVVEVPLDDLKSGLNTLEGDAGPNHWDDPWGQWGWNSINLRVFVEAPEASLPLTLIETPHGKSLPEQAAISINTENSPVPVQEVYLFGNYLGVDIQGQGKFRNWHALQRSGEPSGHIATFESGQSETTWDTRWIPDQDSPFALRTIAKGENGLFHAMQPVEGFAIDRTPAVALYPSAVQPTVFWTRHLSPTSCIINIPTTYSPVGLDKAALFIRSWNPKGNEEKHTPFRINNSPWLNTFTGPDHTFHQDFFEIPAEYLQPGPNLISFLGATQHHGAEILWPGPALLLRYKEKPSFFAMNKDYGRAAPIQVLPDVIDEGQASLKVETPTATYYYHKEGGGFSSLIDRDGEDWINHSSKTGVSGEYRGIPNLVFRGENSGFFHPGNTGSKGSKTEWTLQDDGTVRILSQSADGKRAVEWHIRETFASLEVLRTNPEDPGFWFLYEGTPGGEFDPDRSKWIRSDGHTGLLSEDWSESLAAEAWVAITNPEQTRSLVIWREIQEPQSTDCYYPLKEMTVLGFGRSGPPIDNLMTQERQRFMLSFLDTIDPNEIQSSIDKFQRQLN